MSKKNNTLNILPPNFAEVIETTIKIVEQLRSPALELQSTMRQAIAPAMEFQKSLNQSMEPVRNNIKQFHELNTHLAQMAIKFDKSLLHSPDMIKMIVDASSFSINPTLIKQAKEQLNSLKLKEHFNESDNTDESVNEEVIKLIEDSNLVDNIGKLISSPTEKDKNVNLENVYTSMQYISETSKKNENIQIKTMLITLITTLLLPLIIAIIQVHYSDWYTSRKSKKEYLSKGEDYMYFIKKDCVVYNSPGNITGTITGTLLKDDSIKVIRDSIDKKYTQIIFCEKKNPSILLEGWVDKEFITIY